MKYGCTGFLSKSTRKTIKKRGGPLLGCFVVDEDLVGTAARRREELRQIERAERRERGLPSSDATGTTMEPPGVHAAAVVADTAADDARSASGTPSMRLMISWRCTVNASSLRCTTRCWRFASCAPLA